MSRHRAAPPTRYRPRYGRMGVLGLSLATTVVGLLGGLGVLPSAADDEGTGSARAALADRALDSTGSDGADVRRTAPQADLDADASGTDQDPVSGNDGGEAEDAGDSPGAGEPAPFEGTEPTPSVAPADSGEGRRVVFSEVQQRVWLVDDAGSVERSYPVSGSLTDNLDPGSYEVYSRSEDAVGIDDSGTMQWFVRFTQGDTGAAIGFHSIPVDDGRPLQSKGQLGTPQSHGCIRQKMLDAKAMWAFAPLGTSVVVVA